MNVGEAITRAMLDQRDRDLRVLGFIRCSVAWIWAPDRVPIEHIKKCDGSHTH